MLRCRPLLPILTGAIWLCATPPPAVRAVDRPVVLVRSAAIPLAQTPPVPEAENSSDRRKLLFWLFGFFLLFSMAGLLFTLLLKLSANPAEDETLEADEEFDEELEAEPEVAENVPNNSNGAKPQDEIPEPPPLPRKAKTKAKKVREVALDPPPAPTVEEEDDRPPEPPPASDNSSALAVEETTRLPRLDIVEELVKDLQNPDSAKRHKAIWDLGQQGDSRAIEPLSQLAIDADSQERGLILTALSEIGTRTLKPMKRVLAVSMQDDNTDVRKNAIRDLSRMYDSIVQLGSLLNHAANDPDDDVREAARYALKQLDRFRRRSGLDNLNDD